MKTQSDGKEWERLKLLMGRVGFGEIRIIIKDGKPVRAENIVRQIKLDDDEGFNEKLRGISLL